MRAILDRRVVVAVGINRPIAGTEMRSLLRELKRLVTVRHCIARAPESL